MCQPSCLSVRHKPVNTAVSWAKGTFTHWRVFVAESWVLNTPSYVSKRWKPSDVNAPYRLITFPPNFFQRCISLDSFLRLVFHKAVKKTVHRIFYTSPGQRCSVANYWNDPHHQAGYIKNSKYLPYIDNIIPTARNSTYRTNFLRLRKLILIGGPDDGVITPWQSRYSRILFFITH